MLHYTIIQSLMFSLLRETERPCRAERGRADRRVGSSHTPFRYSTLVRADSAGTEPPFRHLRGFSRPLAISCTSRTFCPTRCFADKVPWIYACRTVIFSEQATVRGLVSRTRTERTRSDSFAQASNWCDALVRRKEHACYRSVNR